MSENTIKYKLIIHYRGQTYESLELTGTDNSYYTIMLKVILEEGADTLATLQFPVADNRMMVFCKSQLTECVIEIEYEETKEDQKLLTT